MFDYIKDFLVFFGCVITLMAVIFACVVPIARHQSCRQAEIYNRINGTSWTCGDFFWAGDQINSRSSTIQLKGVAP